MSKKYELRIVVIGVNPYNETKRTQWQATVKCNGTLTQPEAKYVANKRGYSNWLEMEVCEVGGVVPVWRISRPTSKR